MTEIIYKPFIKTRQSIDGHSEYPIESGIYAFFLAKNSSLHDVKKVEKSL